MKRNKLYVLIGVIFLIVGVMVILWYQQAPKISNFKAYNETKKIEAAKKYGDTIVGWLRVEGTNIDLPLIRATNDTSVMRSEYEFAWTYSKPDRKSNRPAFVSHTIRNVSANPIVGDDTMKRFDQLMSFIYPSFMKENQFIEYTDATGKTALYRIYAVALLEDNQDATFSDTYTDKEQETYIKKVKEESMYKINTDVDKDDLLLTLFTCTRFYGDKEHSFRVDARRLRKNESKTLNKVQKTKKYDKIEARMKEGEIDENKV